MIDIIIYTLFALLITSLMVATFFALMLGFVFLLNKIL